MSYGVNVSKTTHDAHRTEVVVIDESSTIELEFFPKPDDLLIVPVTEDDYHRWIPRPYTTDVVVAKAFGLKPRDRSATVLFEVRFMAPPGADSPAAGTLELKLTGVSQNKGICINYPKGASEVKGVFFPTGNAEDEILEVAADGQSAKTKKPVTSVKIRVAANEAGGFGCLEASCVEREAHGVFSLTKKTGAAVPEDTNQNSIADQWEHDAGVFDRKLPASSDIETDPSGPTMGDQLTLEDEYRGMIFPDPDAEDHALKHVRLDPKVEKLVVVLDDRTDLGAPSFCDNMAAGAAAFAKTTGVKTYVIRHVDSIKLTDREQPILNENSAAAPAYGVRVVQHPVSQAGAKVMGSTVGFVDNPNGVTPEFARANHPHSPKDTRAIWIEPQGVENELDYWSAVDHFETDDWKNWFHVNAIPVAELGVQVKKRREALRTELYQWTIFHELGHACGAMHHSESFTSLPERDDADKTPAERACPMYYWNGDPARVWAFCSGLWHLIPSAFVPDEPPTGQPGGGTPLPLKSRKTTPWKFCQDHQDRFPNLKGN